VGRGGSETLTKSTGSKPGPGSKPSAKANIGGLANVVNSAISRLSDERSIVTLVYLVFLAAVYPFAIGIGGPVGASLLLIAVLSGTAFVIWLLISLTRKKRAASQQRTPGWKLRLTSSLVTLAGVGVVCAAYYSQLFASFLPGLYPEAAARQTINEYFSRIHQLLSSQDPKQKVAAFKAWLQTLTSEYATRKIGIALRAAGIKSPSSVGEIEQFVKTFSEEDWQRIAEAFRDLYGRANVEWLISAAPTSAVAIGATKQYWMVWEIYSGMFINDTFFENMSIDNLVSLMKDPDSSFHKNLTNRFTFYYPNVDIEDLWKSFGEQRLKTLSSRSAFERIRLGSSEKRYSLEPQAFVQGEEWTASVLVLVDDSERTTFSLPNKNTWRVKEVGDYGSQRNSSTISVPNIADVTNDWTRIQKFIPYVHQMDDKSCQSAALKMLADSTSSDFTGTQESIRQDLEAMPDGALAHTSRVAWVKTHLPLYKWNFVYERDLDNVVAGIRKRLKEGVPVTMSTRLTPSGHVILVTGIGRTESGRVEVEAFDPAGVFNSFTHSFESGPQPVKYDLHDLVIRRREWMLITQPNQREQEFYIVGEEAWSPPALKLVTAGYALAGQEETDWEYLEGSKVSGSP
jgi:hypothetical protein